MASNPLAHLGGDCTWPTRRGGASGEPKQNRSQLKTDNTTAMSMRKRTLFSKLMRLVGRGSKLFTISQLLLLLYFILLLILLFSDQVQSSRKCLTQIYEERKRQRQRLVPSDWRFHNNAGLEHHNPRISLKLSQCLQLRKKTRRCSYMNRLYSSCLPVEFDFTFYSIHSFYGSTLSCI